MSAPTNHWKLGLFVVSSVLIGAGSLAYLAARSLQEETVSYKSYFDEGVTGLENGSAVSFRGVRVGNLSAIDVAPDRRHVELTYDLGVTELERLGLASGKGKSIKLSIPPDLRVQIGSTGLSGAKYLQIDFFNIKTTPPPELPFAVPENYIPAAPSTMDAIVRAVEQFPGLIHELATVVGQVNLLLADVRSKDLPDKAVGTIASIDRLIGALGAKLDEVKVGELTGDVKVAMGNLNGALGKLDRVLQRVDGDQGLVASVQRATDSIGDAATGARGLGPEIGDTLGDLRETGAALRMLVEALERDPDMLVKGRARTHR